MTEIDFLSNALRSQSDECDFLDKYVQILSNAVVSLGEKLRDRAYSNANKPSERGTSTITINRGHLQQSNYEMLDSFRTQMD